MSEETKSEGDLREEFRNLSQNLKTVLQTAWESEERKKLQQDIQDGLNDVSNALNECISDFHASEIGQTVVNSVDEFGEKLRSGEVEEKAREGLLSALQKLNTELEKASGKFTEEQETKE
jgi:ElaB/YqjD/DUF883 family membrane-anchored ribosome-binding protein